MISIMSFANLDGLTKKASRGQPNQQTDVEETKKAADAELQRRAPAVHGFLTKCAEAGLSEVEAMELLKKTSSHPLLARELNSASG